MTLKEKPFIILLTHSQQNIPINMKLLIAIIILLSTAINLVGSKSHSMLQETGMITTTKAENTQDVRMPSSDDVKAYFGGDEVKITDVKTQKDLSEGSAVSIVDIIKIM